MHSLPRFAALVACALLVCCLGVYGNTPGESPENPIAITPGTTDFSFAGTPYTLPATPAAYNLAALGTDAVNAVWFRMSTPKANKILDVNVTSTLIQQDPQLNYMVVLAFRESPDGLVQVGCHLGYIWSEVFFGNRTDSSYLIMAGVPSGALEGTIRLKTSEAGILETRSTIETLTFAATISNPDERGYSTIILTSTGPSCEDSGSNLVNTRWTMFRNSVSHYSEGGRLYTTVYRVLGSVFDWPDGWWWTHMMWPEVCETIKHLPVAKGITNYRYYDTNYFMTGGKADHWSFHMSGVLDDLTGTCPGRKTNLIMNAEIQVPSDCPECMQVRHWDGPRLTCGY